MFDYLDYKNRIPLKKCLIDLPRINPLSVSYERFWFNVAKRKQIEGHWVEHNNEWKWIPGAVFQYVNLWNIEMKKKGSGSKGKVIGRPRLRDIEWIKGYVHAAARGFSGFKDDDVYSCHRVLIDPSRDEIFEYLEDHIKESLYTPTGALKQYKPALQYLYEYYDRNLGKPLFHNAAKNVIEIGARNYGKAQPLDTIVYTPNGTTTLEKLSLGDKIYDDSGELTTVTNKFYHTNKDIYELTLQDGRKVRCCDEHLWGVYHRTEYKVVNLAYILGTKWKTVRSNGYNEYAFRLPLTKPVNYSKKIFSLDPYILGCWLGDGTSRCFSLTSVDSEIIDRFYKYAQENNFKVRNRGIVYHLSGQYNNRPNKILRDLNLILNKHIPEEYFYGSIEQRLELLRGLMDTDGTIGFKGYCTFNNTNYTLIKDVERLCWSLGIKTNLKTKKTSWKHKDIKKRSFSYRLFLNTDLEIFNLSRKRNKITKNISIKSISSANTTAIVDIKKVSVEDAICITVDNNSHLFLCNDYIVTHNTMWSGNMCGHNFLTDGVMDYDEWWHNRQLSKDDQIIYTTQTLIGAADSKYVNNLTKHLKVGLENLPGKMDVGGVLYPAPLSKKTSGSWIVGKDVVARYEEKVGGKWETRGSGSGFLSRSFKDNPFAANGSRYGFGLIDEVGFMTNLEDVLGQLHECTTADGEKYGTIWMTGTGGDMVSGATEAAKKVFYDPDAADCLAFDDIFENKGKIGLFIPAWMALDEFRDEFGNVNKELSLKKLLKEREIAKNAKSKKPLYDLLQMKPLVPSEAFLVLEGNIFPIGELKEHLNFLESSAKRSDLGVTGWMQRDSDGKAIFSVNNDLVPADYPTKYSIDPKGAVVVWEEPVVNKQFGQYFITCDPYDQDAAESSVSFGSCFVYKRFSTGDQTSDIIVAEYTGRPEFAADFYEQVRRLAEWYDCKILFENQNIGIKTYFQTKNCLHLLHTQPTIIKSISPSSKVERGYGTHMTGPIKDELEIKARDWLKVELEPGVMQLTKIRSIPLLKELIAYNKDGNFDRAIAFLLIMMQDMEMHKIRREEAVEESNMDNFFSRSLFV